MEGVKNVLSLATWLGVGYVTNLEDVVEWFLKGEGRYQPSWRAVIFALDGIGEIYLADKIRSCGEPVQGMCAYACVLVCTSDTMTGMLI